jgi:predicted transcriptional regulator
MAKKKPVPSVPIMVRIPQKTVDRLDRIAKKQNRSRANIVATAVNLFLENA